VTGSQRDTSGTRRFHALSHPTRVAVLARLAEGSGTPTELARDLGVQLENLAYHVRVLRDMGYLRLVEQRTVRGAVESRYALARAARISPGLWRLLSPEVRERLEDAAEDGEPVELLEGAERGDLERSDLARHFVRLDAAGLTEAFELLEQTRERLEAIAAAAVQRTGEDDPTVLVGVFIDAYDDLAPRAS
jgi:DNA-binding transcriptional ArsR family regulator